MTQNEPRDPSSSNVGITYANNVSIALGVYDVQLDFGIEVGASILPSAKIVMSPQHAKSLLLLLERALSDYEQNVGPIGLPEDLESRLRGGSPEPNDKDALS